ncbi:MULTISPECIES: glycosyl hydrolase family 95 catalytic domain-containing protein [unclassified Streptomyces]|uniref:glycosyl hydrolase family 95 catalytic domain-containing protein n=1 Tax=unclassified Streptomyces TaxID=2593676 RepID=UPI00382B1212
MTSQSGKRSPLPRRAVIGTALGGAAAAALPGTAHAEESLPAVRSADAGAATAARPSPWKLRSDMTTDRAWSGFLRAQDLLWTRLPTRWYEGPFLGDGLLGSMIYQEPGANRIRFTVQHGRVQDHRPEFGSGWGTCRLPVGHLTLEPVGAITAVDWRLSLWNAELTGTVTTTAGTLTLSALIEDEVLATRVTATGGEKAAWTFHPEEALSPRRIQEAPPADYTANPPWTTKVAADGTKQVLQPLTGGGLTATAYRRTGDELLLSVGHSFPSDTAAESDSLRNLRRASSYATLRRRHTDWWHAFYPKSFVSFPDQRLQSFHWIQLYKVASASRAGGPVMATSGPWLEPTPWPAVWWNLNVQLEYWLIHGFNHPELDSLATTLRQNQEQLTANVPAAFRADSSGVGRSSDMFANRTVGRPGTGAETGDLTWALHNVWLSYRHSMDKALLRDTVYPVLRRAINYYLHFLTPGSDGKLHLPSTLSPEYPVVPPQDTNYDLALIRWGCQTLLESAELLGFDDELAPRWHEVLAKLTPYPVDGNGFMIGADTPYAQSHRHYSHLLMVYPLYLVNWDQPESRDLITKSLVHWHALTGAHRGYSYTGAASMYAMSGDGETAITYLRKFFDPTTRFPCQANTHYTEAGPVIETPLSASQSLHDMFCQSWNGVIRVFPAVPASWADVTLHDFRTQGAFLVSAVRKAGATRFIRIRSLAGEPLKLRHGLSGRLTVLLDDGSPARTRDLGGGVLSIDLPRGREVLIHSGSRPDLVIAPVAVSEPGAAWGLP